MAKSEQSAGMCPAGVWGETPPSGVIRRGPKAIGKNIKNYSSNIKNLSPMSIHFSTFAIEKEINIPKYKPQKTQSMITEYLNYLQQVRNLSKHTIKAYRQDLIHFTEYARRNSLTWSTITKQDLVDYQLEIANENLSPASRSRMTSSLRQCLQYAVNMGYLSENPARFLQSPKKEHRLPQTADMADIMAYLRTTPLSEPDRMLHALVALLTDTGIRLQEALEIRRKDINKDEHSILIHGKGNKERKVYYSDLSATHLNRYAKSHQDYIFEERDQKEIRYQMYAFVGQMIKGAHPHLFRHTYATEMLKRGCDINTLRKLMGHQSVKTTEIYAQVEDKTAREKAMKYSPLN